MFPKPSRESKNLERMLQISQMLLQKDILPLTPVYLTIIVPSHPSHLHGTRVEISLAQRLREVPHWSHRPRMIGTTESNKDMHLMASCSRADADTLCVRRWSLFSGGWLQAIS